MHARSLPLSDAITSESPCLLLHSDSAVLGYACVSRVNSSLLLSPPVFLQTLTPDKQVGSVRMLLAYAEKEAFLYGLRGTYVLLADESFSGESDVRNVLRPVGYHETACLSDWRLDYCLQSAPPSENNSPFITGLSETMILQNRPMKQKLRELLRTILSDSTDLSALPTPSPDDLVENWISRNSFVVLYHTPGGIPVGLCCVDPESSSERRSPPIPAVRINYLGVHPANRRAGIASRLIREICQQLSLVIRLADTHSQRPEQLAPDAMNVEISVHVDQSNLPAIQLYRKSGFQLQSTMELWSRN